MTTTVTTAAGSLVAVGPELWRALDPRGRAIGHVRRETTAQGVRYRALRFHPPTRSFRAIGDFWSQNDAVDALRYGG